MKRFKLFVLFQFMAFASLVSPEEGLQVVEDAKSGEQDRLLRQRANAVFSNLRRQGKRSRKHD